jgi:hypothetical protein
VYSQALRGALEVKCNLSPAETSLSVRHGEALAQQLGCALVEPARKLKNQTAPGKLQVHRPFGLSPLLIRKGA